MIVLRLHKGRQGPVSLGSVALLVGYNSVTPETFDRIKAMPLFESLVQAGALEVLTSDSDTPKPEPEPTLVEQLEALPKQAEEPGASEPMAEQTASKPEATPEEPPTLESPTPKPKKKRTRKKNKQSDNQ